MFLCQLKETLAKVPPNHVGKPLLKKPMGPAHWVSSNHLSKLCKEPSTYLRIFMFVFLKLYFLICSFLGGHP